MNLEHELNNILAKIGLSKREQEVIVSLAQTGASTLKDLILKTKLKKPTVYRVVSDLEQKGLLFSDNKKYEKTYTVHEPKRLLNMIANDRRKLKRLELDFEALLPALSAFFQSGGKPKIEMYQDKEGYTLLANHSLDCKEKVIRYLGNVENILEILGEEYDHDFYIPSRLKRGIGYMMLTRKTSLMERYRNSDAQENRETRFHPSIFSMQTTIMIFDDTTIFFSEPKEMVAVAISSPSIAKTMKLMFQDLWDHAEKT